MNDFTNMMENEDIWKEKNEDIWEESFLVWEECIPSQSQIQLLLKADEWLYHRNVSSDSCRACVFKKDSSHCEYCGFRISTTLRNAEKKCVQEFGYAYWSKAQLATVLLEAEAQLLMDGGEARQKHTILEACARKPHRTSATTATPTHKESRWHKLIYPELSPELQQLKS